MSAEIDITPIKIFFNPETKDDRMTQTLLTGASGLLSHQRKLDVVANNLANLNTTAFKSQRILFSDLLYTTIQPASSGTNADFGGTNPRQAGFGVSVAQTSRNHGQGVLTASGSTFDFAIQGEGFFVVSDGTTSYTRAGAFSLDSNGYLVDPATGAFVQRFGTLGEGQDGFPAFQTS
jgi:flagellar hook protein FlgE